MNDILSFDLGVKFQFSLNGGDDKILKLKNNSQFKVLAEKLIKHIKPHILVVEWNSGFSGRSIKNRYLKWQYDCVDLCKKYNVKLEKIHVAEWKNNFRKITGADVTSYAFKQNDAKYLYEYYLMKQEKKEL